MLTSSSRRLVAASAAAAVLWLMFAVARLLVSQVQAPAAQLARLMPEIVPSGLLWGEGGAWLILAMLVGAMAIALAHALITAAARRSGGEMIAAWFATVAAGALVGLALDLATVWGSLADFGLRGLLVGAFGVAAASGALWGLAVGWIPGMLVRSPVPVEAGVDRPATPSWRPAWLLAAASVAIIAVVAAGVAADNARTAAIEAEVAAQREAEAATTFGAVPDPGATGMPVPDKANASSPELDPAWCTPEKAMLLKGEPDAATGHRSLPVQLMNFSEEPCVIEGYPDVAFGDQNQHLLAVTVKHGGSFMAQDPGPQRVEVPPGGYAVSVIGWDAASPHGALVTKTVYAAPTAGMTRGSWPIDLDIIEGSTIAITAWAIDPGSQPHH